MMIRRFVAALALTLVTSLPATAGDPFRDLVTLQGDELSGLPQADDGKWTLVMLWATYCHACEEQKPDISAFNDQHKEGKVSVVGISIEGRDNLSKIQQHQSKSSDSFPSYVGEQLLISSNLELVAGEPLRGTPTYIMLNPENEIVALNPGLLNMDDLESFVQKHVYAN
jgi:thiol-disulfide isomerase/thioredoxin